MTDLCHRCGGELPASRDTSSFCPHCGAPQLYFSGQEPTDSAAIDTTGALPPPRPKPIEWKTAIRCALLVGVVAAILGIVSASFAIVSYLDWIWIFSASAVALTLYQRRQPQARMDMRIGGRIGLVVGLTLMFFLAVSMAATGVLSRYVLHSMAAFDAQMAQMIHQIQVQVEHTAATNNVPKEDIAYVYSQEFNVWFMLMGFAILSAIVLTLSAVGGAVSGLLRTPRSQG